MQIKIVRLREATFSAQCGIKKKRKSRLSIKLEQGVVQPLGSYKRLIVAGVFA